MKFLARLNPFAFFAFLFCLGMSAVAFAQVATGTAAVDIGAIQAAFDGGQVGLGVGLVLSLIVAVSARFGVLNFIPEGARKWVSAGVAAAAAVGSSLVAGSGWIMVAVAGVSAFLAASGIYAGGQAVRAKVSKS